MGFKPMTDGLITS